MMKSMAAKNVHGISLVPQGGRQGAPAGWTRRAGGTGRVELIPEADLAQMVGTLCHPARAGVVCCSGLSDIEIRSLERCLLRPPSVRRPLHPLLEPGAPVHTFEVDGYRSKEATVTSVALLAEAAGMKRRAIDQVEQALDEMLLNALFDAPVDEHGQPRYHALPAAERVAVRAPPAERALLRCAGDERRFVVGVRDRFGSLRKGTVLRYLSRCALAYAERRSPLSSKPGGSGVGLYLIASCVTELIFRLRRGRSTDVIIAIERGRPARGLRVLVVDDDAEHRAGATCGDAAP